MEIKGILFDKDGTLIDFFQVWEPAIRPVIQGMVRYFGLADHVGLQEKIMLCLGCTDGHIDPEGAIAWKSYEGIAQDIKDIFVEELCNVSTDEIRQYLTEHFYAEVVEKRTSYPTFTDLPTLMSRLAVRGIRIGLATTDTRDSTRRCMEHLGIAAYITFWGTADGELPEKPDGQLIRMAAEQWQIRPEEIAVVGDTPNDMRFAANGHALGVGVLSGTGRYQDLAGCADYVLPSVDKLYEWIVGNEQEERNSKKRPLLCEAGRIGNGICMSGIGHWR